MRWIGLTGKLAAGKDYLYSQLWHREPKLVRVSFADTLRLEIEEELLAGAAAPNSDDILPALWDKPYSEAIRRLLQWWGTDFRRAQDPDYWVKRTIERAVKLADVGLVPVFTDVRFPNEGDAVRNNGGIVVRVWADDATREMRNKGPLPDHASETAMDNYGVDYTVDSTSDDELYDDQVGRVLAMIRPPESPTVY